MTEMLPRDELLRLVKSIVEKSIVHRTYFDLDEFKPVFGPPASAESMRAMTHLFGGLLPRDYLEVLSAFDGIKNFDVPMMRLLPSEVNISGVDYLSPFIEAELFEPGEVFVFGKCDYDAHLVAFKRHPGGYLTIVDFDASYDFGEYASFSEYLVVREKTLVADIERFREDRRGLVDG